MKFSSSYNISCASLLLTFVLSSCATQTPASKYSWSESFVNTGVRYQSIDALDSSTVWISGTQGSVASTSDAGATWVQWNVPGAEGLEFRDIEVLSDKDVVLLSSGEGDNSRIYRTHDGGISWSMVFQNTFAKAFFDCVSFSTDKKGLAWSDSIDGKFVLVSSEDGGNTWNYLPADRSPDALDGEGGFAASGTCLFEGETGNSWMVTGASGKTSHLIKLNDHASTYEIMETPMYSVGNTSGSYTGYYNNDEIYIYGGDYAKPDTTMQNAYKTNDEGISWTPLGRIPFTGTVYGSAGSGSNAVVVGPKGSAYSTDSGMNWTLLDSIDRWSVTYDENGSFWAVGPNGRVSKLSLK